MLSPAKYIIHAPRRIFRSVSSWSSFQFSSASPVKHAPEGVQKENDQFMDKMLSGLNYDIQEDYLAQSSFSASKEFSETSISLPSFEMSEIIDLMKFLAKSPNTIESFGITVQQLADACAKNLGAFTLDNVTVIIWALGKLNHLPDKIAERAEQVILQNLRELQPSEVAILMWSFAKMEKGSAEFWSQIIEQAVSIMPRMSVLDLQQTTWSLAKIQNNDSEIWQAVETNTLKYLKNLENDQALSLIMMSFAKMEKGSDRFWKRLESKFESLMEGLREQALTNSLWALARRNKLLLIKSSSLESLIIRKLYTLKDIEVVSICWAFIKLCKGSQDFWRKLSKRINKILASEKDQIELVTLCSCAWVLKNLGEVNAENWKLLEGHILAKQNEVNENHLYSILASFALKRQGSDEMWRVFEAKTKSLLGKLDSKGLANVIWCFATREKGSQYLWKSFSEALASQAPNMTEQGLIISLWGFAKSRKSIEAQTLEPVLAIINERFGQLKPVDIGMLMWSLGKLASKGKTTQEITAKVLELVLNEPEMANIDFVQIVYALSELRACTPEQWETIEKLVGERADKIQEEGWSLLGKAAAGNAEFSEAFWESLEQRVVHNAGKFSKNTLVVFMSGFSKKRYGSNNFWTTLEEEIKKKMEELDDNSLAECTSVLSKRRISQNEFWIRAEEICLERLNQMKVSPLVRLAHSFGASEKGSIVFWNELQRKLKEILTDSRNIQKPALIQILLGFAKKKKGDHQFWNLLEKRVLEVLKSEEIKEKELSMIIKEFSRVRRGSRELWTKVIGLFMANLQKVSFRTMLGTIRSLDFIKEIDETEKEMLYNKCLDKLFSAEEEFGLYLHQLSLHEEVCAKISEEDLKKLAKKIAHLSQKAADSLVIERMKGSFDKICEFRQGKSEAEEEEQE